MSEVTFIDKDPEQILIDTIDLYQQNAGQLLNEADPERLMIDCIAFREVLLRNGMEYLMRQNFIQFANGQFLDLWGLTFGVTRIPDESDDNFRIRIISVNSAGGIGTKAAYKSRILSIPAVADVLLFTKNDDNSLFPGTVRLIPIQKLTETGISRGEVHNSELESEILSAILAPEFGVVGNVFVFKSAVPVNVDGTINVRAVSDFNHAELAVNINYQLNRYFGELSLSFMGEFGTTQLNSYLNNASGLQQVISLNFPEVPVLETGQFYQRGIISVNIE